jgi:sarcosine oxidase
LRPARPEACGPDRLPVFVVDVAPGRVLYGLPDMGHGVKVALHHGGEATTAEAVRRTVDQGERAAMVDLARTWVPGAAGDVVQATVCLYTNTTDRHFAIDYHPDTRAAVIASACSGHGFKFAAAIGEILADLATDTRPAFDIAPFRLGRLLRGYPSTRLR